MYFRHLCSSALELLYIVSQLLIFTSGTETLPARNLCPSICSCSVPDDAEFTTAAELQVDCHRTPCDVEIISLELDQYLSQFTSIALLSISNSPLRKIPPAVCNMTKLLVLNLDENRLTELPKNCFQRMTNLRTFRVWADNNIQTISDGVFSGLQRLEEIVIAYSRIEHVCAEDFFNSSDLKSLKIIDLSRNKLTSLDTWIFARSRALGNMNQLTVNLIHNEITTFTNTRHLDLNHGNVKDIKVYLKLDNNPKRRMEAMMTGWGFQSLADFVCLFLNLETPAMKLDMKNVYYCDCLDYDFVRYFRVNVSMINTGAFILQQVFCKSINVWTLANPVSDIALIDLICRVSENCPSECVCIQRPHNKTFHLQCSNAGFTSLPKTIPNSETSRYKLEFSYNNQLRLEPQLYFQNTSILDVSYCSLEIISESFWKSLPGINSVHLHGNRLTTLPAFVKEANISFKELSLYNNPWSCSCDNAWLKSYLASIHHMLVHPDEILCATPARLKGKSLLSVGDEEFCVDPAVLLLEVTLIPILGGLSLIAIAICIIYRLRYKIHTALNIHPFDRDECQNEGMIYDVFLCSAQGDTQIARKILDELEAIGYRVCFHLRDFEVGETICNNITHAIYFSKRTVCLLSNNFIRSQYCMEEFNIALHRNVELKRNRLILVLLEEPFFETDASNASLKHYLSSHNYLDYNLDNFHRRLNYALPMNKMGLDDSSNICDVHRATENVIDEEMLLLP